jgi:signal transduction histidine kinase
LPSPSAPTPSLRRALLALGAAGAVASAVPLAMAIHSVGGHHRDLIAVFGPVIGGAFIGTGLMAWARRPENRFGALMVAVGFTYCVSGLIVSTDSWPFTVGAALLPLPYAILLHILVAFPTGRLQTRFDRALVAAAYVTATAFWWVVLVFQDNTRIGLPANPLLIADRPRLLRTLTDIRLGVVLVLLLTLGVVLARRWREASPAQRQGLAPVLAGGGLVLGLYAAWSAVGIAGLASAQETLERARVVALATVPFAFLAGLLRSRVAGAAAVSELVASLGGGPERRGRLRDALADALGDPSLDVVFWFAERGGWVDGAGSRVELPAEGSPRICTPIEHEGRPIAAIVHDASLAEHEDLVRAVGGAAALALENERLDAELRANVQELRASRARIVESAAAARRRIERDLHDGAQQQLLAILLGLRLARSRMDDDPACAADLIDAASSRAAFTRRSSPTAASARRSTRSPRGCRSRSRSPWRSTGGCPRTSRRPPTSSRPRRSRTSLATRMRPTRGSTWPTPTARSRCWWPTMGSGARTPSKARACVGSSTASPRSTAAWTWTRRRAAGRRSAPRSRTPARRRGGVRRARWRTPRRPAPRHADQGCRSRRRIGRE